MAVKDKKSFAVQQARGNYGEGTIVPRWSKGIDYHNLQPVTHLTLLDGTGRIDKAARPITEQVWIEGKKYYNQENDANRDWLVWDNPASYGVEAKMERHEAKAQFRAYGTDPCGEEQPTENIFIEVDAASVMNIEQCRNCTNKRNPAKQYGWHHPNPIYRADWYHHYLPLHDRGEHYDITNDNTIAHITEAEWRSFANDDSIGESEAIIAAVPFEYMLIMSGEYQQELLERYCGIKFGGMKAPVKERYHFLLPAAEVTRGVLEGDAHGQATIVPIFDYGAKDIGSVFSSVMNIERVWTPKSLAEKIMSVKEKIKLSEADRDYVFNWLVEKGVDAQKIATIMKILATEEGYMVMQARDMISSLYQMTGGYNEPFSTLDIMMHLPIYERA